MVTTGADPERVKIVDEMATMAMDALPDDAGASPSHYSGYAEGYGDALARAWPVLVAAHALASRFGNNPGPFDDVLWEGAPDALKVALKDFAEPPVT